MASQWVRVSRLGKPAYLQLSRHILEKSTNTQAEKGELALSQTYSGIWLHEAQITHK